MVESGEIQPKLRVSQPDDAPEREAERVADAVLRMETPDGSGERRADESGEGPRPLPDVTRSTADTGHVLRQPGQNQGQYPKTVTIGTERVNVDSEQQKKKAEKIIKTIESKYGIDVNSDKGLEAIKNEYPNAPKQVKNKLSKGVWQFKELKAIKAALNNFAPILGKKRDDSSRSGDPQAVQSISRLEKALDATGNTVTLDPNTLGQYFQGSKNFTMFKAGLSANVDFSSTVKQLRGTAVHEMAHGVFGDKEDEWAKELDYWTDKFTKSGKQGAEEPITEYGKTNAAEDLAEAVMYYFVERQTLTVECPKRSKIISNWVNAW